MNYLSICRNFFNSKNLLIPALVISLIIKIFFFIFLLYFDLSLLYGDQSKYWDLSEKIFNENVFFYKEFGTMRVPLYPLFLAGLKLINSNIYFIIFTQMLINFYVLYLIFKIGFLFSLKIANISVLISALSLNLLNSSFFILTESLFLPFFLIFMFNFLKFFSENNYNYKYLIISSIFLGLATLTRPLSLYFFIIIFFVFFKKNITSNLKSLSIFLIIFSIILSPWCIRNYKLFDNYSLTNSAGPNLAGYYLPYLASNQENKPVNQTRDIIYKELKKTINYDQNPFNYSIEESKFFLKKIKNYSLIVFIETWLEGNLKFIFTPPIVDLYYLLDIDKTNFSEINEKSFIKSCLIYLFDNENKQFSILMILSIFIIMISRMLSLISLFVFEKKNFLIMAIMVSIIILNLILTGPIGSARYRIIVEPFLIIMFSISLNFIIEKFSRK